MKNKKLWIGIVLFFVFLGIVCIINDRKIAPQKTEGKILIGSIAPLTGPGAVFGKYNHEATQFCIPFFTNKFNLPAILKLEDSKSTANGAINAYMKLRNFNKDLNIIAAEMTSVSCAIYPLISRDLAFLISIAVADDLRSKKDAILVYPGAAEIYNCLMQFLSDLRYEERISLYCIDDDFGRSITEKFASCNLDGRIDFYDFNSSTDIKSLVASNKAKCACVCGYGSQFLSLIRELQSSKKVDYIVASPEFAFPEYYTSVDSANENMYYMEFGKYDTLRNIMGNKLGRAPNLIDFLIFGKYLSVFSAVQKLNQLGLPINGQNMYEQIKGHSFSCDGYEISFDENGQVIFYLVVSKAKTLLSR